MQVPAQRNTERLSGAHVSLRLNQVQKGRGSDGDDHTVASSQEAQAKATIRLLVQLVEEEIVGVGGKGRSSPARLSAPKGPGSMCWDTAGCEGSLTTARATGRADK